MIGKSKHVSGMGSYDMYYTVRHLPAYFGIDLALVFEHNSDRVAHTGTSVVRHHSAVVGKTLLLGASACAWVCVYRRTSLTQIIYLRISRIYTRRRGFHWG